MANLRYHLRQGASCLRQSPAAATVAALTLALSLGAAGASFVLGRALEAALHAVGSDARITVFLLPDVTSDDAARLVAEATRTAGAETRAEYVSAQTALARLRADLGDAGAALDALAVNPLPPTIEVRLGRTSGSLGAVRAAAGRLATLPFAQEVDWGAGLLERLELLLEAVRALTLVLFALVFGIGLFLVGNVVRLTVYARRDEIEILRLVGATDAFVAAPFVVEGALQGLVGGLGAAGLVAGFERVLVPLAARTFGFGASFVVAPLGVEFVALVGLGAVVGVVASVVAVHRFLRTVA